MSQEPRNRNSSHKDDSKNLKRSSQRDDYLKTHSNRRDRYDNDRDRYRNDRHKDDFDRNRKKYIGDHTKEKDKYYSKRTRDYNERKHRDRSRSRDRLRKKSRSKSKSSSVERKSHRKYLKRSRSNTVDRKLEPTKYYSASLSRSITPKKLEDLKPRVTEVEENKHHAFKSNMFRGMQNSYLYGEISSESLDGVEGEIDKEKIHKEMQERLRQHLAAEGKIYPPPKPKASHPIFANDGSFLETFKKMQEQQQQNEITEKQYERKHIFPVYGKRRGGKILKTGIVDKPRPLEDVGMDSAKDAWSIYMQEVKKYKNTACDIATKTRPLLK